MIPAMLIQNVSYNIHSLRLHAHFVKKATGKCRYDPILILVNYTNNKCIYKEETQMCQGKVFKMLILQNRAEKES